VSVGGNLAATGIPTAQTFAYNPDNSLKTIGSVAVTNDNNGNITCMNGTCPGGVGSFAYDARGHLAQTIVAGPTTTDYGYDAFGRRIVQATSSGTKYFLYDGFNKVQDQPFPSGPKVDSLAGLGLDEDFMWGASEPPTYAGDSLLKDALGSTLALTDPSGNVLEYDSYEPYGNLTILAGSYQGSDFHFTGRELNPVDGLYYMRSRYYSPALGRFISRDPAGLAGGINLYAYAGDSPTNFTDPTGMDCDGNACGPSLNGGQGPAYGHGAIPTSFQFDSGGFLPPLTNQDGPDVPLMWSQNRGGIRNPDYMTFEINYGPAFIGPSLDVSRDRYRHVYLAPGLSIGKSYFSLSLSVTAGWVGSPFGPPPPPAAVACFVGGFSVNGGGGFGVGGGFTWSLGNGVGPNVGFMTPQAGFGAHYGFQLF
jgi:RHS repeat-associated protein